MQEIIPIRKIITSRKLKSATRKEDLALATSIQKKGLLVPILVDGGYNLVDGLRRLRAAESLGFTEITAVVTGDYDVSIQFLTEAHDPELPCLLPVSIERIWQINSALDPQMWARITRRRALADKTGIYKNPEDRTNQTRVALAKALRVVNGTYVDNLSFFYRRVNWTNEVGALARLYVKKMESGELTPYAARKAYSRWAKEQARTSDEATQRQILSRAATNLNGIARPLSDVGSLHHNLTSDELYTWEKQIHDARTVLTSTINKIRTEREQRNGK